MTRPAILLIPLLIGMIFVTGCTNPDFQDPGNNSSLNQTDMQTGAQLLPSHPEQEKIITDMKGRAVTIPVSPSRVAVFSGPLAQIPYIIGVQDTIIATTPAVQKSPVLRMIDSRLSTLPTPRGASGEIDFESLSLLNPDLVIAPPLDGQMIQKKTSIPVVMVVNSPGDSMTQIKEQVRFLGEIFNHTAPAEKYCSLLDQMNSLLRSRLADISVSERKKVFCGYDASHMMTYGNDTFLQERIALAGGINSASSLGVALNSSSGIPDKVTPAQSEVSLEQVIAWNPDVIIIDTGSPQDLYNDSRWASIRAVREHQVYIQPYGIFKWSRQNAESALFYPLWLAKILYPDRLSEISLEEHIFDFFQNFFSYSLSEEQIKAILAGSFSQQADEMINQPVHSPAVSAGGSS